MKMCDQGNPRFKWELLWNICQLRDNLKDAEKKKDHYKNKVLEQAPRDETQHP